MPRPLPDVAAGHPVRHEGAAEDLDPPHHLVIRGQPDQVSVARAFVGRVLGSLHPGLERVTLLTSELVTNSVSHSDSRREGGTITVVVRPGTDRIRVEVYDDGGACQPALCCDGDLAETGRGLRLVDAYSLGWDYYRSGTRTVTWFECPPEPID